MTSLASSPSPPPTRPSPTSALAIDGLSAGQASHIQTLLETRGVSPDQVQAYVADLMMIIESGFDSYFASLGAGLGTPVPDIQEPDQSI